MEWRNQVAVVTGGARGIGRATARLLAQRGAAVCVNYAVHAGVADAIVAEVAAAGGRAIGMAADVADSTAVEGDGRSRRSRTGSSDHPGEQRRRELGGHARHLRPGAGRAHAPSKRGRRDPCHARSDGEHASAALRADRQSGLDRGHRHRAVWQCILRGNEGQGGDLTRRFAMELGSHGITVNAVAPGFVRTDMTQRGRGAADWPGTEASFAARAMMCRIGEPEDIANAVVFLASPESGWITAQGADGGRWANGLHWTRLDRAPRR